MSTPKTTVDKKKKGIQYVLITLVLSLCGRADAPLTKQDAVDLIKIIKEEI